MNNSIIGIDLAKHVFQVHIANANGKVLLRKKLKRSALIEFISQYPKCIVAMESCGGAHYFGRKFREFGHEVRLIAPKFVKPYVKSNKNDAADAEAIAEAASRENMRFVPIKSEEQQAMIQIHKVRSRLIKNRTALTNEIQGLCLEYGIALPKGGKLELNYRVFTENINLPDLSKRMMEQLFAELKQIKLQITECDREITVIYKQLPDAIRISKIPGVGVLTSTAMLASIPDFNQFKSSRDCSAYLGLVPRQMSSGGKPCLGRISKRGNSYLRKLLVQGALAALKYSKHGTEKQHLWLRALISRAGIRKAAIALANKNARVICVLMKNPDLSYRYDM